MGGGLEASPQSEVTVLGIAIRSSGPGLQGWT